MTNEIDTMTREATGHLRQAASVLRSAAEVAGRGNLGRDLSATATRADSVLRDVVGLRVEHKEG